MCGRTACTLEKKDIQASTRQYSHNKDLKWVEKFGWQNYSPSYNLCPSQISPVIINHSAFVPKEKCEDFVITPMRWGFIPSWYKGSLNDFSMKTNNCRLEGILEKPTYKRAVVNNQRCIVLADGFYEWKVTENKQKQPYFIYFPQKEGSKVFTEKAYYENLTDEWKGPQLLTMAGLFDSWQTPDKEIIYSYSIITMDSSKSMSFIHERMPAVLSGVDQVSMWLDVNRVPTKKVISILSPVEDLEMYPVSRLVNNSINNSITCITPLLEENKKSVMKETLLTSWLKKSATTESPLKKQKVNDS